MKLRGSILQRVRVAVSAQAVAWIAAAAFAAAGCNRGTGAVNDQDEQCTLHCEAACGSGDGCGGICGCPEALACNAQGACVASNVCADSCEGRTCGQVCGHACGTCGTEAICLQGQCLVANHQSCPDCSVQLLVDDVAWLAADVAEVSLRVTFHPTAESAKPRVVDLRLVSEQPVEVLSAQEGPAMLDAGKELFQFVGGSRFRRRGDGSFQFFAFSKHASPPIDAGTLFTAKARVHGLAAAIRLERQPELFAPAAANAAVQRQRYEQPVVVIR